MRVESVDRMKPARLEEPTAAIVNVLAELAALAATLGLSARLNESMHCRTGGEPWSIPPSKAS